jgi:hypothetical protein
MTAVEDIIRAKKNGMRPVRKQKRIRLHCIPTHASIRDIEALIEQQAEEEAAMSRYEHGLEVG